MFRLTTKSDYGLILLSNLSRSKKLVSVSSVAKKNKLSAKFLSQVAGELKKAGIQAYCYNLVPKVIYAASLGMKVKAYGIVK